MGMSLHTVLLRPTSYHGLRDDIEEEVEEPYRVYTNFGEDVGLGGCGEQEKCGTVRLDVVL
jgi:hypothetical protein